MNTTNQSAKSKVSDFELLDHGIDHSQYFPGCGVALTNFDNVVTGAGDNFSEALNDALEMIAQTEEDNIDISDLENKINSEYGFDSPKAWPTKPSADDVFRKENNLDEDDENDSELYYYVSLRYNKAV